MPSRPTVDRRGFPVFERSCDDCGGSVSGYGFHDNGLEVRHLNPGVCERVRRGVERAPLRASELWEDEESLFGSVVDLVMCANGCERIARHRSGLCSECQAERERKRRRARYEKYRDNNKRKVCGVPVPPVERLPAKPRVRRERRKWVPKPVRLCEICGEMLAEHGPKTTRWCQRCKAQGRKAGYAIGKGEL